jgi:hypothetical protein
MPPADYLAHLVRDRTFDLVVVAGSDPATVSSWIELAAGHATGASWLVSGEPQMVTGQQVGSRRVLDPSGRWTLIEGQAAPEAG